MSPNSINFTVYLILNYIVFEMSWINTFWVWVWVWVYKAKNFINDIAFGTSLFVFCDFNTYFQL